MGRARIVSISFAALALGALLLSCGGDGPHIRTADLTGAQETPPVTTSGSGSAKFKLSLDRTLIRYQVEVEGLTNVLFAHVHVGQPGEAGPIIFNLATSSFTEVSGDLTSEDLIPAPAQGITDFSDAYDAMLNGGTYVNVHTLSHPGGEVRGQIE